MRGKGSKLSEGEGSKLDDPCPKIRLSQDRLPILRTNVVRVNVASSKCHSTHSTVPCIEDRHNVDEVCSTWQFV